MHRRPAFGQSRTSASAQFAVGGRSTTVRDAARDIHALFGGQAPIFPVPIPASERAAREIRQKGLLAHELPRSFDQAGAAAPGPVPSTVGTSRPCSISSGVQAPGVFCGTWVYLPSVLKAILRGKGSPVKVADNLMCVAMAAVATALACYCPLSAQSALVSGRALVLLHT